MRFLRNFYFPVFWIFRSRWCSSPHTRSLMSHAGSQSAHIWTREEHRANEISSCKLYYFSFQHITEALLIKSVITICLFIFICSLCDPSVCASRTAGCCYTALVSLIICMMHFCAFVWAFAHSHDHSFVDCEQGISEDDVDESSWSSRDPEQIHRALELVQVRYYTVSHCHLFTIKWSWSPTRLFV